MLHTVFGEFPIRYYNHKNYNKVMDDLINDTLNFVDYKNNETTSYSLREEKNHIVFDCLAPSVLKENISILIKDNYLLVKTIGETKNLPYFTPLNLKLKLTKDVIIDSSFADLENGVLTIKMPIKEEHKERKISFK